MQRIQTKSENKINKFIMCISSTAIIELNSIIKITLSDGIECYVLLAIIIKLLIIIFRVHVYVSHMQSSLIHIKRFFNIFLFSIDVVRFP